eukprot:TRINITY_DN8400_c0_g1_i1.p1 TRINITY_DN8400_c0_g1~~TRINITY_DN8400_c0_g1_i1.p1  ORF type:complete len:691 (+),score=71.82 TRINITY_DN8400_c0_g1_i1:187-2073(+)
MPYCRGEVSVGKVGVGECKPPLGKVPLAGINADGSGYPRSGEKGLAMCTTTHGGTTYIGGMGGTIWAVPGDVTSRHHHSHTGHIRAIHHDATSPHLITACDDRTVRLWTSSLTLLHTWREHHARVWSVYIKAPYAASGGEDGMFYLYHTEAKTVLRRVKNPAQVLTVVITGAFAYYADFRGAVSKIEIPAGTGSIDRHVVKVNEDSILGSQLRVVRPFENGCFACSSTGAVSKVVSGKILTSYKTFLDPTVMETTHNGSAAVIGSAKGQIQVINNADSVIFDACTGKITAIYLETAPETGLDVAFSAADSYGVVFRCIGQTMTHKITLEKPLKEIGVVTSIYSGGGVIATGHKNGVICVDGVVARWKGEPQTHKKILQIQSFGGNRDVVTAIDEDGVIVKVDVITKVVVDAHEGGGCGDVLGLSKNGVLIRFHGEGYLEAVDLAGATASRYHEIDKKLSRRTATVSETGTVVSYVMKAKVITLVQCVSNEVVIPHHEPFLECDADFIIKGWEDGSYITGGETGIPTIVDAKYGTLKITKRFTPPHESNIRCAVVDGEGWLYTGGGNEKIVKWSWDGSRVGVYEPKGGDTMPLQRVLTVLVVGSGVVAGTTGGVVLGLNRSIFSLRLLM